jgi:hypothetical protein
MRYMVRGTRYVARGMGHVVQDTRYVVQGGTGHLRAQNNNKDNIFLYIWHTAGWIGTPMPEGWLVGAAKYPLQ